MNKSLLFIIIFITNFCTAQSIKISRAYLKENGSIITDRPLVVSDFKGSPTSTSPETAVTFSSIDIKLESQKVMGNSESLTFKVMPFFIQSSWIKEEAKNYPDKAVLHYILKHEQGHYDLAIIGAFEIQRAVNLHPIHKIRLANNEVNQIYSANYAIYQEINGFYESDTDRGRDEKKQFLWNGFIERALRNKSWAELINYITALGMQK